MFGHLWRLQRHFHTFSSDSDAYGSSTGTLTVNVQKSPVIVRLLPTNRHQSAQASTFRLAPMCCPNGRDAWPDTSVVSLQYQSGATPVLLSGLPATWAMSRLGVVFLLAVKRMSR